MNQRTRPGAAAFALMIMLCATWGLQQIAVKIAMAGISPILQGGLRSAMAAILLLGWMFWRQQALLARDGSLRPGLVAGTLFALEFVFIYVGLSYTNASRMVVFLYTAPCFTVLGLHLWVAGERLALPRLVGVGLAFLGIALAFADGFEGGHWIGDLCGVLAAVFWAATTVLVRATSLARVSAAKVLLYQLATSAALMLPLSALVGESGVTALTPAVVISMVYQVVIVAFASYLIWFWLLTRYLASRLTVFTFLTPLFGVGFGVLLLHERLSVPFGVAALLVVLGIVLVNAPTPKYGLRQ